MWSFIPTLAAPQNFFKRFSRPLTAWYLIGPQSQKMTSYCLENLFWTCQNALFLEGRRHLLTGLPESEKILAKTDLKRSIFSKNKFLPRLSNVYSTRFYNHEFLIEIWSSEIHAKETISLPSICLSQKIRVNYQEEKYERQSLVLSYRKLPEAQFVIYEDFKRDTSWTKYRFQVAGSYLAQGLRFESSPVKTEQKHNTVEPA